MSLLIDEIAELVADGLEAGDLPFAIIIRHIIPGEVDESQTWEPVEPVIVEYQCQGFIDTYSAFYHANQLVQDGDQKVVIVANTLAVVPEPGMEVTARGQTMTIIAVEPDPAIATWTLQARPGAAGPMDEEDS